MLTIPGTASLAHLDENCAAATIKLEDATLAELSGLTAAGADPDSIGTSRRD